jgi:pSer/pThr/pTyr-binding forkhead associated (FHA) protein
MVALLTRTLGVVCPSCDFLNVVAAVRCMACGSATDGPPESSGVREPPGLKKSAHALTPVPTVGAAGSPPPGTVRGAAARPTFQSSASQAAAPGPSGPKFSLTVLAGPARGQRFKLASGGAQVGRSRGVILFPDDPFTSPLHATLTLRDGRLLVRDEGSTSGVYVSIAGTETIVPGTAFCTGARLFRFGGAVEPQPPWNHSDVLVYGAPLPNGQVHYAIEEVLLGDRPGRCKLTPGPVFTIGQGNCDFSYPSDEGLAARHCELAPLPVGAMLRDLSGGLGTYVRIQGERPIKLGDRLRIGQQTMQVEQL